MKKESSKVAETIQYTTTDSLLGLILIAQSTKGLCALLMGQTINELKTELQRRFPQATLVKGEQKLDKILSILIKSINDPSITINFPLDERGTKFQLQVWQALREIETGTTMSYSDIAKKIGSPKAVRAVAGACAANALAVITPCHRVIRSDGHLSGYRWGIDRKKQLLQLENDVHIIQHQLK